MDVFNSWWMWVGFIIFILLMLAADLYLLGGRRAHKVSIKESLAWTFVWISLALVFNFFIWLYLQHQGNTVLANQKAFEFFTGYVLEKSLSIDNIFVFLMIFHYFAIPAEYQQRVLLYGVLGAIVMRACMILMGVWLIHHFEWVLYVFGLFLAITGIKMLIFSKQEPDLAKNPLLQFLKNHLRITDRLHNEKFSVLQNGVRYLTPLFLVLILIEVSDLIFAVDSIPAVFGITDDPFIVFTSNIFAILGLRALYFLFAEVANHFYLLKYGIALVLTFIGIKMLIVDWYKIPVPLALIVIALLIAGSIGLSMLGNRQKNSESTHLNKSTNKKM